MLRWSSTTTKSLWTPPPMVVVSAFRVLHHHPRQQCHQRIARSLRRLCCGNNNNCDYIRSNDSRRTSSIIGTRLSRQHMAFVGGRSTTASALGSSRRLPPTLLQTTRGTATSSSSSKWISTLPDDGSFIMATTTDEGTAGLNYDDQKSARDDKQLNEELQNNWRHPSSTLNSLTDSTNVNTADTTTTLDDRLYQELQSVATQLRYYDTLYYDNNNKSGGNDNNVRTNGVSSSGTTTLSQPPPSSMVDDDIYDALAQREAEICQQYPALLEKWRLESGLGNDATRYQGRVGSGTTTTPPQLPSVPSTDNTKLDASNQLDPSGSSSSTTANQEEKTSTKSKPKKTKKKKTLSIENNTLVEVQQPRLKRTHATPMLSLDNVHTTDEVLAWLERIRKKLLLVDLDATTRSQHQQSISIVTEPKLDGVSLSLRYERQQQQSPNAKNDDDKEQRNVDTVYTLQWASTRGDGLQGTDVTSAIYEIGTIPVTLSVVDDPSIVEALPTSAIEIRGEIVFPRSIFETWQKQQSDNDGFATRKFSNPRNAASGILLRKDQPTGNTTTNSSAAGDNNVTESQDLRSKLRFYAYDIVHVPNDNVDATGNIVDSSEPAECSTRDLLQKLGFTVPMPSITTVLALPMNQRHNETSVDESWTETDISRMLQYHEALCAYRDSLVKTEEEGKSDSKPTKSTTLDSLNWGDFDVDGCVHKISSPFLRSILGNSNRAPRWAVAHKFAPTAVITELWNIEIQVGRTGALTPVAILKPVDLGGVTVQRATMHNFYHMRQMLGGVERIRRNSTVMLRRAGDVIPQVVSRVAPPTVEEAQPGITSDDYISLDLPSVCPACGANVVVESNRSDSSSSVGQVIRCNGPPLLCSPRAVAALKHAFARDAFDITGLSEARIQQLMDEGFLRYPSDLFALAKDDAKLAEVSTLTGWGSKSVDNLVVVAKRVAANGITLSRFIYSLGIRQAGQRASAQLASLYRNVDSFLADVDEAAHLCAAGHDDEAISLSTFSRLQDGTEATKGIGTSFLAALRDFAKQKSLVDAAQELARSVKVIDDTSAEDSTQLDSSYNAPSRAKPLSGMSVVFTGSIGSLSRSAAQKTAAEMGAKATPNTISKTTGLVVAGERGGKKLEQAEKLGIRIIDAAEFMQMVENFRSQS